MLRLTLLVVALACIRVNAYPMKGLAAKRKFLSLNQTPLVDSLANQINIICIISI